MRRLLSTIALVWTSFSLGAQNAPVPENSDDRMACHRMQCGVRNEITVPDAAGYQVFKCDFHMHTVYADAMVSPKGRVYEAWYEGLDVISVSEHVGVHKTGIDFPDHNSVNREALDAAKQFGMVVIPGVEITRAKPFGHMNALFVKDASVISEDRYEKNPDGSLKEDELGRKVNNLKTLKADVDAMISQGAFIQWNHPGWPDKKTEIFDIQKEMIAKGQIHAMEICNHSGCGRVMRPMNLVLAKEYTLETNLW